MVLVEDVTEDSPPRRGNPNQQNQEQNTNTSNSRPSVSIMVTNKLCYSVLFIQCGISNLTSFIFIELKEKLFC